MNTLFVYPPVVTIWIVSSFAAASKDPCLCFGLVGTCHVPTGTYPGVPISKSVCFWLELVKRLTLPLPRGHPQTWGQPFGTRAGGLFVDCMAGEGDCSPVSYI